MATVKSLEYAVLRLVDALPDSAATREIRADVHHVLGATDSEDRATRTSADARDKLAGEPRDDANPVDPNADPNAGDPNADPANV